MNVYFFVITVEDSTATIFLLWLENGLFTLAAEIATITFISMAAYMYYFCSTSYYRSIIDIL
jgi:hypothetical protein